MIFVTVGTHEQQFDRLVCRMDKLKMGGMIEEEVIIQTGYGTYKPKTCAWKPFFSYQDMVRHVKSARIVITHGGPSSFMLPLQMGKVPVVVPRLKCFGEHVNDHQMLFVKKVSQRYRNIIMVTEMNELGNVIKDYDALVAGISREYKNNNVAFNERFTKMAYELMRDKK